VLADVERSRVALPERGVELALIDWGGEGPLVLLAHANGFCAAMWDLVARELRRDFHVIGFDARGHGDSSRPPLADGYGWHEFGADAAALAEVLLRRRGDGSRAYGIGHSFGGTATLDAAAQRPDLFARIALLDPVLHRAETEPTRERIERMRHLVETAQKRRSVWSSRDEVRAAWAERELFASWDPRAYELYLSEGFRDLPDGQVELKCPGEVEGAVFGAGGRSDIFELAAALEAPALLLFAATGHFDRGICEALVAKSPMLRLEDLPHGHLLPMEAPKPVAERLLSFGQEGV
jgi:pimeloyl-ACP methyl ester carboxylesterase